VLTGVYAFGTVSGGHFNPAVTLGAAIAKRVEWKALLPYWIVQVLGGLLTGLVIYIIATGRQGGFDPSGNGQGFDPTGNMAANGYGVHSPGGYALWAVTPRPYLPRCSCLSSSAPPKTAPRRGSPAWRSD
jgi:aquaporin Z